jgi:hypothetical protein
VIVPGAPHKARYSVVNNTGIWRPPKCKIHLMRKGQTKGEKGLTRLVATKLTQSKYEEIEQVAKQSKGETISSVVRKIIHDKPVKVFRHDESLDLVMEELAANRSEIRAIGVNINQMAKLFNSYPELKNKVWSAKNGYDRYLQLESRIEYLLSRVDQLAKKWLSE